MEIIFRLAFILIALMHFVALAFVGFLLGNSVTFDLLYIIVPILIAALPMLNSYYLLSRVILSLYLLTVYTYFLFKEFPNPNMLSAIFSCFVITMSLGLILYSIKKFNKLNTYNKSLKHGTAQSAARELNR